MHVTVLVQEQNLFSALLQHKTLGLNWKKNSRIYVELPILKSKTILFKENMYR